MSQLSFRFPVPCAPFQTEWLGHGAMMGWRFLQNERCTTLTQWRWRCERERQTAAKPRRRKAA